MLSRDMSRFIIKQIWTVHHNIAKLNSADLPCYAVKRGSSLCHFFTRPLTIDTRNIGIMAHIDAGKTTTTERMLYYSGHIKRMGDIDSGNTVMDYLPTEIERGITIQSAAISFKWLDTQINLIDTPGHVDFTIEVERSLRVLDGAVAVFDGSRGVEAQSRTVWRQADHYNVPRIAYINKMDKSNANLAASIQSLQNELKANTILLQLPIRENGLFKGIVDVVSMEKKEWDISEKKPNHSAKSFITTSLTSTDEEWESCLAARAAVIEQLCDLYDDITMAWLEGPNAGNAEAVSTDLLRHWLRRATIDRKIVPVLCGSSYKNVAVQSLLDAVVYYLPRPSDIQHAFTKYYENSLTAMAFKVSHHKRHGPLVFVRVYSGTIKSGMTLYNPNKSCSEKITRLMSVFADEYLEVGELNAGDIGIISGVANTITGDTLVESKREFIAATERATDAPASEEVADQLLNPAVLAAVPVPEPVFFCNVEVGSITQEKALNHALDVICREDPSIRVKTTDSGSLTLSGMGELHMDIIAERIREEFKLDVYMGSIQVAYREVPNVSARHAGDYSRTVLGKAYDVFVDISLDPSPDAGVVSDVLDILHPLVEHPSKLAAAQGIVQACQKGQVLSYPVMGAKFMLHSVKCRSDCPAALVTAAAYKCTKEVLNNAECQLIEPIMKIEINAREASFHDVLGELHKRHAVIKDFTSVEDNKIVFAHAPVAEMKVAYLVSYLENLPIRSPSIYVRSDVARLLEEDTYEQGFTSRLRSATSGLADLSLEIAGYEPVSQDRLQKIKQELSGAIS